MSQSDRSGAEPDGTRRQCRGAFNRYFSYRSFDLRRKTCALNPDEVRSIGEMNEKRRKSEAAEVAANLLEEVLKAEELLEDWLRRDWKSNCLHHEIKGYLHGLADGVIQTGQPRLREAVSELIEAVWSRNSQVESVPVPLKALDQYSHQLCSVLFQCGAIGFGTAGVQFDWQVRPRSGKFSVSD